METWGHVLVSVYARIKWLNKVIQPRNRKKSPEKNAERERLCAEGRPLTIRLEG